MNNQLPRLAGKAAFRLARALRLSSYLIGAFTAIALVTSPFVAPSLLAWFAIAGATFLIAVAAYLALYRGLPRALARFALAILPDDQLGYAQAELAIWEYEDRHGSAPAAVRREFHQRANGQGGPR